MRSVATYSQECTFAKPTTGFEESRRWLIPHYLGLDAVVVAVVWQSVAAHFLGVHTTWSEFATLALCVFTIYLGDRLRDSYSLDDRASPRHRFVYAHRGILTLVFITALVAGSTVAALTLSREVLISGLLLCPVVLLYFAWTHLRGVFTERGWLKECAVGIVFAAGVFLSPALKSGGATIPVFEMASAFAVLCALNCLTIGYHESRNKDTRLYWIAVILVVLMQGVFWLSLPSQRVYFSALLIGSAFLCVLMTLRSLVKRDLIATFADIALVMAGLLTWVL